MKQHIRHSMILVNLVIAVAMILTACTAASTPTAEEATQATAVPTEAVAAQVEPTAVEAEPTAVPTEAAEAPTTAPEGPKYQEAPMLAELVSSGELPPLDERLPVSPFVLKPRDEIGKYGQTLFSAFPAPYQGQNYQTLGFYEPVLTWNEGSTLLIPNLVELYEPSEDQMTFKMVIRKNLKWSDGTPVTTADIQFAYDDMWNNIALNPVFPSAFSTGGEPAKLNVIDDYTFELSFAKPYPSFQYVICKQGFTSQLFVPSNYLQQFHENYIDKAELAKMTQEGGFETWNQLFTDKNSFYNNPDLPNLYAWKLESISEDKLTRKFVRNPYYFKVDTEGNQLPYLDYQQVQYVDNAETLKMMTLAGDNEYIGAPIGEVFADWPIYAENAEAGNYRMITGQSDFGHIFLVMPNLSSQDPQKGQLLANKDFRIALSHAINRDELISLFVTVGDFKGTPAQQSPVEASPYYDDELTKEYTEYNVDKANELLDGIGLTERGSDGFRLGLDGKPMSFVATIPTYSPLWVDGGTLIAKYWREVGLNVEAKPVSPEIWNETVQANKLDFTIHSTGSGGLLVINSDGIDAYSMPYVGWMQRWGVGFVQYINSEGKEGVEPPEFVYEMNKLREEILYEADPAIADAKVQDLLNIWKENFPIMGISRPLPSWFLMSNDLKNTPQDGEPWAIFMFGVGGNVNPCQFYKE